MTDPTADVQEMHGYVQQQATIRAAGRFEQMMRDGGRGADAVLKQSKNAVDVDRLHILSLDFNRHKFENMRRIFRLAIISTVFTTMVLFLGVRDRIHRGVCAVLIGGWWLCFLLVLLHFVARYGARDRQVWRKFIWTKKVK